VTLPSGQLVSQVGDGDVPGPVENDCKGHVPLLAAESEKRNFLPGAAEEDPVKSSPHTASTTLWGSGRNRTSDRPITAHWKESAGVFLDER